MTALLQQTQSATDRQSLQQTRGNLIPLDVAKKRKGINIVNGEKSKATSREVALLEPRILTLLEEEGTPCALSAMVVFQL
jgi:hypothetical protein